MTTIDFTGQQLRLTQKDLVLKRILSCMSTNTTIQGILRDVHDFKFMEGEPPKGKLFSYPGMHIWIIRERPVVNAQGSIMFVDMEVALKVFLKNAVKYSPFTMNDDGTFKNAQDSERTPLRVAYALSRPIKYVLENDGYDNNWYYTFVQIGVLGEINRINFDYESFGGELTGGSQIQTLATTFVVRTWQTVDTEIPTGDASITFGV